jgi:TP901 family phage tail tape measure protein
MIIRRLEALFTIKSDLKAFKHAASEVDKFADFVEKSMTAIASLWGLQALHGALTDIAAGMSNIANTAGYLGITTNALQELRYAANQSGISIDTLDDGLKELQIRAVDATTGSGEAFDAFNKLGVKTTDFAGRMREPLELLEEVADKLLLLPTQSERIWVLDSMLGDQGAEMLKMLNTGSFGLKKIRQEAQLLNHIIDEKSLNTAINFNKSIKNIKNAFDSISKTMASGLMPAMNSFMGLSLGILNSLNKIENRASFLRTTIISLGLALSVLAFKVLIAFGPMILSIALAGAGIAALALVIDDLWSAFSGGESIIKDFFDFVINGFEKFSSWLLDSVSALVTKTKNLLNSIMPDFLKAGFSSSVKLTKNVFEHIKPMAITSQMAPQLSNLTKHTNFKTNQNLNVSVNIKSNADPKAIGAQVSQAFRKELEKEHFAAFMGVSQYAD